MVKNINFRKPIKRCFIISACIFTISSLLIMALHWGEIKSSYHRQSMRFVDNLATYIENHLSTHEKLLDTTLRQFNNDINNIIIQQNDNDVRHWLFERLSLMPDVHSIVYADFAGNYIRLPNIERTESLPEGIDPRTKIWFTQATESDFGGVHYTSSEDTFDTGVSSVTLSKSLVNSNNGEQLGVLAIRLNTKNSEKILNSVQSPLPGQTWIINENGSLVASEKGSINLQYVADSAVKMTDNGASFFLPQSNNWYFYSAIGNTGWVIVHEVPATVMNMKIFEKSATILYSLLITLVGLFFCWWIVRNALSNLYIRIANGIRNGALEQKSEDQLLFEEIHNSTAQKVTIENESMTDGLTGLKNRRAFDKDIEAHQHDANICLAIVDIDNFKTINDTYGHTTGDIVLKTVSDIGLRLRGLDNITLYRYGGEEIAILFQDMQLEQAYAFLELWRTTCEHRQFRENMLQVTFSGGISGKGEMSIKQTLDRADTLLYKAKHSGKNRIISAEAE